MPLNLTKTYTVKSNAQADVRKAVVRGECTIGEFTVVSLNGGFRIVPAPEDVPLGRWPKGAVPGRIRDEAAAASGAEIIAPDGAAMTAALADDRDAPSPHELPIAPDRETAEAAFEEMTEGSRMSPSASVTPGLARLRADARAETIREAVIADQMSQMREELVSDPKVTIGASVMADYRAEHPAPAPARRRGRGEPRPAKPAASTDGLKVLVALFFSPALGELADDARVGEWVDYKTIIESDRPHGLAGRQVSGLIAGLQRRGLIECRMDKPGKYSTRLTAAGFELARAAGR
jgi:hypothetical protein